LALNDAPHFGRYCRFRGATDIRCWSTRAAFGAI